MSTLAYINVFARDIEALSGFYAALFGFAEIKASRSPIFRGLDTGACKLGFSAPDAYDLLGLSDMREASGAKTVLTFDLDSDNDVERRVTVATGLGARLIKAPCRTYYGWYQAVLLDPEQNVFRINHKPDATDA